MNTKEPNPLTWKEALLCFRGRFEKFISLTIALLTLSVPVMALELDTSVDDEIRRNYNPSKLEQTLPALPKVAPNQPSTPP